MARAEYWSMSNYLSTPRILACPADDGVRVAKDFNEFGSALFRANAASYFINLHTSLERPETALFGDRNLSLSASFVSCSLVGITPANLFTTASTWTNAIHGTGGNLVTMDGRVAQTGTPEMQTALLRSQAEGPNVVHLLKPR
jgi:hypothetical protein